MHVPISHATLQCSATPSASMHPRPNPSFLSMAVSKHCLGALSKGMGRGNKRGEVKKREQNRKTVSSTWKDKEAEGTYRRQGRMLSVKRCGAWLTAGGHSHTVSATSLCSSEEPHIAACLKMELKQSFVFNFLQAFIPPPPPPPSLLSAVFP